MRFRALMMATAITVAGSLTVLPAYAQQRPETEQQLPPEVAAVVKQIQAAIQQGNVDAVVRELSGGILKNPPVARLLTMAAMESATRGGSPEFVQAISQGMVSALMQSGGSNGAAMVQQFTAGAIQGVMTANSGNTAAATTAAKAVATGALNGASESGGNNASLVASLQEAVKSGATDGASKASNGNTNVVGQIVTTVNTAIVSQPPNPPQQQQQPQPQPQPQQQERQLPERQDQHRDQDQPVTDRPQIPNPSPS